MKRFAVFLVCLLAAPTVANASEIDDAISKFIGAKGFQQIETGALEEALDTFWLRTDLVSPGGAVGPIEKALLLAVDAIPSTRTRTAVTYGEILDPEAGPVSYIEIRHYNLGPQIHRDTIEAYGRENVAAPHEFGVGDHIAWRFVFVPMMGNAAMLVDAAHRIIPEDEARASDCTGIPCLDTIASYDDIAGWTGMDGTLPDWPRNYPDMSDEVATPAHAVAELAVLGFWANAESGGYQWTGGEHPEAARGIAPFRFIGIDRNLGQDTGIDAVWIETLLNDHAISELGFRRAEFPGDVYLMRFATER
jgi:hypothetical protein